MPKKIIGNNLTPQKVKNLEKVGAIALVFNLRKKTEYGGKIEKALDTKYSTAEKTPDYGGNILVSERGKLRRRSHDCGDSSCGGLGDVFYVSGMELKSISQEC